MRIFSIDWAPLRIPLHRRLETLAVFYYSVSFLAVGVVSGALVAYLLFTRLCPLSLAYLAWLVWDKESCNRGGRRSQWARSWTLWKYFRDYFPIQLVKTCELPPNKNYLFGYHPHGIMCAGAFCNFATEGTDFSTVFPGIRPHLVILRGQFWFPLQRDLLLSSGMCAATRESLDWILGNQGLGNAAVLVIGGAVEALDAHPGSYRLVLSRRRGFVRVALNHGYVCCCSMWDWSYTSSARVTSK